MRSILVAIQEHFNGDPDLVEQLGDLWLMRAPNGTSLPYAVLTPVNLGTPEFNSGIDYTEESLLQIDVYADGDSEAVNLLTNYVQRRFDEAEFDVGDEHEYLILMRRTGGGLLLDEGAETDEVPGWHAFSEYRLHAGRRR